MFSKIRNRSVNAVQAFHNDEAGQGTVEMLMMVGGAAVVLLVLVGFTKGEVMTTLLKKMKEIMEIESKDGAAAPAGK
jgi:hypothetical protein